MSSHQIPLWRTFESGSSPLVLGGGGGGGGGQNLSLVPRPHLLISSCGSRCGLGMRLVKPSPSP